MRHVHVVLSVAALAGPACVVTEGGPQHAGGPVLEVLAPVDGADVLAAEGVVFRVRALGLEGPVRIVSDEPTPGIQGTLPFAFEGQPDEDGIVEIPLTFPLRQHVPTTWYARVGTFETPEQSWVVHTPPQVLRLDLEPEAPVTGQSLVPTVAVYDSHLSDINAGDEIFQSLRWYRNGEEMAGFVQVPGAWVQEGDTWTAEVEVRDAFEAGQTRREDVVIGNAPPTITDVRFHPAAPLAGMRVDVEVTLDDPEGDAYDVELGLRVAPRRGAEGSGPHLDWPSADAEEQPFVDAFTMPAMAVRLGNSPFSQDRAWVHVVATDARGARTDRWVEVGIGHRAPEVTAVVLQPAAPVTGDTVQVVAYVHEPDGQPYSSSLEWIVDGVTSPGTTVPPLHGPALRDVRRGQQVQARVTVVDSLGATSVGSSELVTVGNAPPTKAALDLSPAAPAAGEAITCTATAAGDPEDDMVRVVSTWTGPSGLWGDGPELPSGITQAGETWICDGIATDALGAVSVARRSVRIAAP